MGLGQPDSDEGRGDAALLDLISELEAEWLL
jgi:hypothetical protein